MRLLILGVVLLLFYSKKEVEDNHIYTAELQEVIVTPPQPDKIELHYLARLIHSEAGNQPFEGKMAVGQVVINRARIKDMSVTEVIFAPRQFCGVRSKHFRTTDPDSQRAAYLVLIGVKTIPSNTYYFLNEEIATNRSWVRKLNRENEKFTIGDHSFYKLKQNAP